MLSISIVYLTGEYHRVVCVKPARLYKTKTFVCTITGAREMVDGNGKGEGERETKSPAVDGTL